MKFCVDKDYEIYPLNEIKGEVLFYGKTKFQCLKWIAKNKPKEEKVKKAGGLAGSVFVKIDKLTHPEAYTMTSESSVEVTSETEKSSQIEDKEVSEAKERVIITYEDLTKIMIGGSPVKLREAVNPLNEIMADFLIADTFQRSVDFLAQIGHESGSLNYQEEIASGKAYEGRKDLGNTQKGDGEKYKGSGYIQLTGRSNYEKFEEFIFSIPKWKNVLEQQLQRNLELSDHPILKKPEIVRMAPWNVVVCGYFWERNNLIKYSDNNDFIGLTRRINGGTTNYQDRVNYRMRAVEALTRYKHLT